VCCLSYSAIKIKSHFDMLNNSYAKFYNSSEHLAVDHIFVLFRERELFSSNTFLRSIVTFGIEIYKLCDITAYNSSLNVFDNGAVLLGSVI
jgi:hypothetical protein